MVTYKISITVTFTLAVLEMGCDYLYCSIIILYWLKLLSFLLIEIILLLVSVLM